MSGRLSRGSAASLQLEPQQKSKVRGSKKPEEQVGEDQQLYSGLIRLHVLHHASERPVYGLLLIEELAKHGYKLSSGTLYPMLHNMEKKGYLRSIEERSGKLSRRVYRSTRLGQKALESAKRKVSELFAELFENVKETRGRKARFLSRRANAIASGARPWRADSGEAG